GGGSDRDLTHMLSHNATTLAEANHGSDIDDEERKTEAAVNDKTLISGPAHGHIHAPMFVDSEQRRKHLSTYILELGIALHSVIVGMTLAVTGGTEFKTLLAAISFHQFFEGMALGTRIAELQFARRPLVLGLLNALVFALTTPLGQIIGIGIRQSFAPRSPSSLIVMGILDSLSAGILMYSAIVNLLVEEFGAPGFRASSLSYVSIYERDAPEIVLYVSANVRSVLGYDPSEMVGNSILNYSCDAHAKHYSCQWPADNPELGVTMLPHNLRHKDGRKVFTHVTSINCSGHMFAIVTGFPELGEVQINESVLYKLQYQTEFNQGSATVTRARSNEDEEEEGDILNPALEPITKDSLRKANMYTARACRAKACF
ncbi:hypothetical protein GGF44_004273, partial [Coemansia sp. RSA 1694]